MDPDSLKMLDLNPYPDSLNSDPDTDSDPAFQVNPDPCDGFFGD